MTDARRESAAQRHENDEARPEGTPDGPQVESRVQRAKEYPDRGGSARTWTDGPPPFPTTPTEAARAKFRWIEQVLFDTWLAPSQKTVLLALAIYFNVRDGYARPSLASLAYALRREGRSGENTEFVKDGIKAGISPRTHSR